MFGLPAILIVGGLLGLKVERSWLTTLGDASYSTYLAHPYVLTVVALVLLRLKMPDPALTLGFVALSTVLIVGVSLASYYVIERPSNEAGRAWLRARRHQPA